MYIISSTGRVISQPLVKTGTLDQEQFLHSVSHLTGHGITLKA